LVYNYRIITIGKRFEKRSAKNDLIKYLKNDPEPPTTILLSFTNIIKLFDLPV